MMERATTGDKLLIIQDRALAILKQFAMAQTDLCGKAVMLTNGIAGTVYEIHLDDLHGLRITIEGHEGLWPVSSLKQSATD